jgi:thymidylate synthase (FAD)
MVSMGVEIFTQRDIAAQILRHRSFSFQEFSQRYTDASEIGYSLPELRLQDHKNRQNSFDHDYSPEIYELIQNHLDGSQRLYKQLIGWGVAKECARRVLPLCQNTRLFMTGSVRSWIHYLEVRTGPETQKEHRLVAQEIKEIFTDQFPNVAKAVWPPVEEPKLSFWKQRIAELQAFFHV